MRVETIASKITGHHFTHHPVIIAIDGFGGAGKSTLARELSVKLGSACVVEIDDFFLKEVESDANKSNFDRERLKTQVLIPLRLGQRASFQKLVWDTNKLSDYFDIPDVDYVIIEGVSTLHPDVAKYMDYKIWLEIPADAAKERMIKRDKANGEEHGKLWDHWTESYQAYKDLYRPEMLADLLVNHQHHA